MGESDWLIVVQAVFLAVTAIAALWAAMVTSRESRASGKRDRTRRLDRVSEALGELADVWIQTSQGVQSAVTRFPAVQIKFRTAVKLSGFDLPMCRKLAEEFTTTQGGSAEFNAYVDAAVDELAAKYEIE